MVLLKFHRLFEDVKIPTKAHDEDACFDLFAHLKDGDSIEVSKSVIRVTQSPLTTSPLQIVKMSEEKDNYPIISGCFTLPAFSSAKIPTGIVFGIPKGYRMDVKARSGRAYKYRQSLTNGVGTIDSGYDAQVFVLLTNNTGETQKIQHLDKIAQFSIEKVLDVELCEEAARERVQPIYFLRGEGGLGSTGNS